MAQTDYHVGMDPARLGAFSATIDGVTATLTNARYWHVNLTSITDPDSIGGGALATIMTSTFGGGPKTVTVAFSAANLRYTISGTGAFDLTSISSALTAALGAPTSTGAIGGPTTGASSYTSSYRPYYVCRPLIAGLSQYTDDYQPEGLVHGAFASDGTYYIAGPSSLPTQNDWMQVFESSTPLNAGGTYVGGSGHSVYPLPHNGVAAVPTMPWSWWDFWQVLREGECFAWCEQVSPPSKPTATMYRLRAEGANFRPVRASGPDYDLWSLSFKALVIGRQ